MFFRGDEWMSIGDKIYNLRKKKNMSQEELASVLNVSRQTISKWETGESNPDFDKIVPLCNFFEISTDELMRDENVTLKSEIVRVNQKNKALTISMCIIIFIVMCILGIVFDEIGVNDSVMAIAMLSCIAAISIILVYYFTNNSGTNRIKSDRNLEKRKLINSIINMLIVIIYFVFSYIFTAWAFSWIIFIIGALIKKVVQLIMMLGDDKNE